MFSVTPTVPVEWINGDGQGFGGADLAASKGQTKAVGGVPLAQLPALNFIPNLIFIRDDNSEQLPPNKMMNKSSLRCEKQRINSPKQPIYPQNVVLFVTMPTTWIINWTTSGGLINLTKLIHFIVERTDQAVFWSIALKLWLNNFMITSFEELFILRACLPPATSWMLITFTDKLITVIILVREVI